MLQRAFGWAWSALLAAAAGLLVAAHAGGADPAYYVRKGTWQETMQACREAMMKEGGEKPKASPAAAGPTGVRLGPWYMIGPFYPPQGSAGFAFAFPPEAEINLAKTYDRLRWSARAELADGVVHMLSAGADGSTYLYRTITAASPTVITGYFGSDDGLAVWLNGKKLISHDVPRGPAPNQDRAPLALQAGENRLLLKIHNNSGGHGFYFSTSPSPVGGAAPEGPPAHAGLWNLLARDFRDPRSQREMAWEKEDNIWTADWAAGDGDDLVQRYVQAIRSPAAAAKARQALAGAKPDARLQAARKTYYQSRASDEAKAAAGALNFDALELAVNDLVETCGEKYPKGKDFLARLEELRKAHEQAKAAGNDPAAQEKVSAIEADFAALKREALMANPLLDFDRLIVVKRGTRQLGLPQNWQGNSTIPQRGYDNEIAILSPLKPEGELKTLYRPDNGEFVGDLDLHFDADRMLFSKPGSLNRWQVWEIKADGTALRQVTKGEHPDVDQYSACYLPDGRIIFCSTACYLGVPCVGGGDYVGSLYIMDAQGGGVRQLTFDQDHSWYPRVLNNGRVIYTRWEYSDIPHYFSRLLFEMNPDGTAQFEYYGSNSYWPNSIFYARPIPGHPSKVAAVVSGHHGVPRMGELVILDSARGRHEADGAVQRIPGFGKKVEPTIADGLVEGSWPKFVHPFPLSEKYLVVSCKLTPQSNWAIYLVDTFDNMLLLREEPGYALFEPIPLKPSFKPPVIPDKVKPDRKDATVYLVDVYQGPGLKGVPRGSVKSLRIYSNHYAYRGMGGHIEIGIDGPWDCKRILGTVPVNEDGSALFKVPANVPIVVEPLDAEGKALQIMRSWYTAMPGEFASCVGCHEPQTSRPPPRTSMAINKPPSEIRPWYGPERPFGFPQEVQPVLDKYCVGCHDGGPQADGRTLADLRAKDKVPGYKGRFTPSYEVLHRYVRRPGPESDYHMPKAAEYHADTSELVQMLQKGHHGVRLDAEAWDRIITWIDMNVPCHGTWSEYRAIAGKGRERRLELAKLYANLDVDPEAYPAREAVQITPAKPEPEPAVSAQTVACPNWPFDASEAARRQGAGGPPARTIDLGGGVRLDLVRIPAGEFVMGDMSGAPDERPMTRVSIAKPFWMGKFEVTNAQYAAFDPAHDSRVISQFNKDQDRPGEIANRATQPVIRVSWLQAMAFCRWLSQKSGETFTLPTEAQWEYACRAGTGTPLYWGQCDADFGKLANLADQRLNNLCRRDSPRWIPCVETVNDGAVVTENVGKYQPNAWGLHDMHGNVWEWTLTTYAPYPYSAADGRDGGSPEGRKVVRGGSFYDRPQRARSAYRLSYPVWQAVFSVGFRVVAEDTGKPQLAVTAKADK
jgi:formylglycine-generating enzyme required for sulfatase activity